MLVGSSSPVQAFSGVGYKLDGTKSVPAPPNIAAAAIQQPQGNGQDTHGRTVEVLTDEQVMLRVVFFTIVIAGVIFASIFMAKQGIQMLVDGNGGEWVWRAMEDASQVNIPGVLIGGSIGLVFPTIAMIANAKRTIRNENFWKILALYITGAILFGAFSSMFGMTKGTLVLGGIVYPGAIAGLVYVQKNVFDANRS